MKTIGDLVAKKVDHGSTGAATMLVVDDSQTMLNFFGCCFVDRASLLNPKGIKLTDTPHAKFLEVDDGAA